MDSKSISRKGVGVRFPSLVPGSDARSRAAVELGRALFPALERYLRETTAALESGGETPEPGEATGRAAGWCLGVLSAAHGCDALRGRRERAGLAQLVGLLEAGLVPKRISPEPARLPRIGTTKGAGWEVAFLGGTLFHLAARHSRMNRIVWSASVASGAGSVVGGTDLSLECGDGARLVRASLATLIDLVPDARVSASEDRVGLAFPPGWLSES